jgi:TRAP-type C4-dicarboxylate transport system permease large subunit
LPFFACLVLCIAIITAFPITVTWLPDIVMGK